MMHNIIDIALLLVALIAVWRGWHRGFVLGILDLLSGIGSVLLALRYYQPVARWLGPRAGWNEIWDVPAAFILTAIGAGIAINLIGYALVHRIPHETHRRTANRLLGVLPGLANGLISATILAALLLALPLTPGLRAATQDSTIANRLAGYAQQAEIMLRPIFGEAIAQTLNLLTIRPQSNESVDLPYSVDDARPAPDLEAQMLDLVNQERIKAGLDPLVADPELTEVARRHAADMFARGYFAHLSPDGLDPFERISAADIPFQTAGENLALAPTVAIAHRGLMNSPGHRANILHRDFGRIGIGIVQGGLRGLMVTQLFRD
jgi:uncharacterized protein YkwD